MRPRELVPGAAHGVAEATVPPPSGSSAASRPATGGTQAAGRQDGRVDGHDQLVTGGITEPGGSVAVAAPERVQPDTSTATVDGRVGERHEVPGRVAGRPDLGHDHAGGGGWAAGRSPAAA